MPLLDWLEKCALPEESRLADPAYADVRGHGNSSTDCWPAGPRRRWCSARTSSRRWTSCSPRRRTRGLNVTAGLVLSDRILREDLLCTPDDALAECRDLIDRWHGKGRLRYAVTPRFSLSASEEMLDVCVRTACRTRPAAGTTSGSPRTSTRTWPRSPRSRTCSRGRDHYLDTYHQHGLVNDRSVFAHNVHATDNELALMGEAGAWAAHCPTSNSALGSGLFPLRRHVEHGVGVALGSDVGAGTGLFLPKEGLQAYFMQQLLGARRTAAVPGAPAVPGDPGRRAGPRAGGPGRRLHARQGLRRRLAAPGRRQYLRRQPARTPPTPPTRWPGPSRSPPPPTWPACGSGGNRPMSADTDPARQGRSPRPPPAAPGRPGRARTWDSDRDGTRSPAAASGHMTAAIGVTEAQVNNAGSTKKFNKLLTSSTRSDNFHSAKYTSTLRKHAMVQPQELPQR